MECQAIENEDGRGDLADGEVYIETETKAKQTRESQTNCSTSLPASGIQTGWLDRFDPTSANSRRRNDGRVDLERCLRISGWIGGVSNEQQGYRHGCRDRPIEEACVCGRQPNT